LAFVNPNSPWVRVSELSKDYGACRALENVSIDIRRGEILGLIGPNGAGKTTLFECMAGVLPPSRGWIDAEGRRLSTRDRSELLFYLPDAIAPWPSECVNWALDYAIGFFGGRPDLRDEVVQSFSLPALLREPIGTLSKGQRKRVMLAFGLLMAQPLLLADEPFDGLDLRQSREVAATLRAHAHKGRTLFLSIHQIADAARVCDRLVLLSNGKVCGTGTIEELATIARHRGAPAATTNLEEIFLALT
jgi:ABC-2 type transport system ATP-binding protein